MKKILLSFFVSCIFFIGTTNAQEREIEIHYGEGENPSYVKNEVIVSFNPGLVLIEAIDDTTIQSGTLQDFLSYEAISAIEDKLAVNSEELTVYKIFKKMISSDSISFTRSGEPVRIPEFWATFVVKLPRELNEIETADSLNTLFPVVNYSELNYVGFLHSVPNDSLYPNQYSLYPNTSYPGADINIEPAWDKSMGSNNIKIGVYDTRINWLHEDFGNGTTAGSKVKGGWDYVDNTSYNSSIDLDGHGTHVAGIIGALRNNTRGIAGIAGGNGTSGNYGCQLFSMGIFKGTGPNSWSSPAIHSQVASAIIEGAVSIPRSGLFFPAFGFGLHAMNHSWGGSQWSNTLRDAIETANMNEVTFVASSGNGGAPSNLFPSSFADSWVLKIGASGNDGKRVSFSTYGYHIDLIAPGTSDIILTTNHYSNIGYSSFNGTSAAAPHATGVVGLMQAYFNDYSVMPHKILFPEDIEHILERTAKDKDVLGYDQYTGWGLLDAGQALNALDKVQYDIQHYSVNTSANDAVKINNYNYTHINTNKAGIGKGYYYCDIYKVTKTVTVNYPTLGYLIDAWPLNEANRTNFLPYSNTLLENLDRVVEIQSRSGNQITLVGYVYHVVADKSHNSRDHWYPFNIFTQTGKMAYSAYVSTGAVTDPGPGGGGGSSSAMAFPNPTVSNSEVIYEITSSSATTFSLINSNGVTVQQSTEGIRQAGMYSYTFDLSSLPSGLYLYQIIAGTQIYQGKIVKQ